MFWSKQRKIDELELIIESKSKIIRDFDKQTTTAVVDRQVANEGRKRALEELAAAVQKNVKYEKQLAECAALEERLEFAVSESKVITQALEDENKDLMRQNELLRSVLGQLRVIVKLPAQKAGRK